MDAGNKVAFNPINADILIFFFFFVIRCAIEDEKRTRIVDLLKMFSNREKVEFKVN